MLVIRRHMTAAKLQIREENCSTLAISLVLVSNYRTNYGSQIIRLNY